MKKSQILAALALAFALGVVAPVASSVSAFTEQNTTEGVIGLATGTEVDDAIVAIEDDPTYDLMKKLADLSATYATNPDYAEFNNANAGKIVNKMDAVAWLYSKTIDSVEGVARNQGSATLAETQAVLNKVNTVDGYTIYYNIWNAIEQNNSSLLSAAIQAYNGSSFRAGAEVPYNNTAVADPSTFNTNVFANYATYKDLFDLVKTTNTNITKYQAGVGAWTSLLNTRGLLTTTGANGQSAYNALFAANASDVTLAALNGIYTGAGYLNYSVTDWAAVATAVAQAVPNDEDATAGNYTKLMAMATKYGIATGKNKSMTDIEIAKELIAYKPGTPVTPSEPGTEEEGDNKGDGKGDGASTPDTGVIANSEATATSTASIMAGIATALTAAGVGVVAFRNIRRNKKA